VNAINTEIEDMSNWSELEVELIIQDYFQMLQEQLKGIQYNKTGHRNNLIKLLNNRSEGSIEFKHQNISAALINIGSPYITGYKPRWNYQHLLEAKIIDYLSSHRQVETTFDAFAHQKIEKLPTGIDFNIWEVQPPEIRSIIKDPTTIYTPVKKNFLEIEQRNASVGKSGEQLVMDYEIWRLNMAGKPKLANSVEWVSKDQGDGAGFDILSRNLNGSDIYIEVKTTTLGKDTPIFFSKRENDFAEAKSNDFHLYRVFDLNNQARMFQRNGRFKDFCNVEAVEFRGAF
jgi:hypothetical protein